MRTLPPQKCALLSASLLPYLEIFLHAREAQLSRSSHSKVARTLAVFSSPTAAQIYAVAREPPQGCTPRSAFLFFFLNHTFKVLQSSATFPALRALIDGLLSHSNSDLSAELVPFEAHSLASLLLQPHPRPARVVVSIFARLLACLVARPSRLIAVKRAHARA